MLEQIQHKSVSSIIKQYDTDGHSPYLVLTNDLEQYVLKTFKNGLDRQSLLKEFLCTILLNIWKIKCPKVAILSLNADLSDSPFVLNNNRFSYSNMFFGSEFIANSIDLQLFISSEGKVQMRKIFNASVLLDIALFDIWIENDDRKPSNNNLLLCSVDKGLLITPIDHALTFASMQINQLNPEFVSFSDNDSIAYSPLGIAVIQQLKINVEWLAEVKKRFYLRISETEVNFQQICAHLPPEFELSNDEKQSLYNFLFNEERNKNVFEQFSYIISSIK